MVFGLLSGEKARRPSKPGTEQELIVYNKKNIGSIKTIL